MAMDSGNLLRRWTGVFFYPEFGGSVYEDELLYDAWEHMTRGGLNGLDAEPYYRWIPLGEALMWREAFRGLR